MTSIDESTRIAAANKVLDHGHVHYVTGCVDDLMVANSARVSFNTQVEEMTEREEGLIRFLMRDRHGSPFEHGYLQFRIKAPIFVFREWHRHRVGHSYNEWSARYSTLEPEFYVPQRVLSQTGKPGAYTFEEVDENKREVFQSMVEEKSNELYNLYREYIDFGISRQQARMILPVNIYSEMIWSCNPRSLMHFLSLRNSEQAQFEIREYARVIEGLFSQLMPITCAAFVENGRVSP